MCQDIEKRSTSLKKREKFNSAFVNKEEDISSNKALLDYNVCKKRIFNLQKANPEDLGEMVLHLASSRQDLSVEMDVLKEYFNQELDLLTEKRSESIGKVEAFLCPESQISSSFIVLDGRTVSRELYPLLADRIQGVEGFELTKTTITVPNLIGYFLRYDNREVGSLQADSIQSHQHTIPDHQHTIPDHNHTIPDHDHSINTAERRFQFKQKDGALGDNDESYLGNGSEYKGAWYPTGYTDKKTGLATHNKTDFKTNSASIKTNQIGEEETRVKNVAVIYAIKAK